MLVVYYHGGDGKSDFVHAVCKSMEGAWIDPWQDKLDVTVIDAISTIFHLPKSTKFEIFQMSPSPLINYIVRERQKGDYLRLQYVVIESTDISNVSIKKLLSHEKKRKKSRD